MKRKFSVIVACTLDCGIGKDGGIPWKLPKDMKHFRDITCCTNNGEKQNMIIMGRKTWESLPIKPLPGRKNVVVTRATLPNVHCVPSLHDALLLAHNDSNIEKVFVIGGAQLYNEAMKHPLCETLYVTMINDDFECDTFFDSDVMQYYKLNTLSDVETHDGIEFAFAQFTRHH